MKKGKSKNKILRRIISIMLLLVLIFVIYKIWLKKSPKSPDIIEERVEYLYAKYKSGPVKYEVGKFVKYEDIEQHLKSYGYFDASKSELSMVYDNIHKVFSMDSDSILDGNKKISKYQVIDSQIYVDIQEFLSYFNVETVLESTLDKEQKENIEKLELKNDMELGLYQVNPNRYVGGWDAYGNDAKQIFSNTIDVVIPKWLALQDGTGNFNSHFDKAYFQNLKNQSKKIWVLASNSFDPDLTSTALNSSVARTRMVDFLTNYAVEHGVDGINIDFENMHLRDSDVFVQFIAELNVKLQQNNKLLSVCVTVPGGSENWSLVYDRERIAQNCDFLTLMAYDQYWASSQNAGPVAAYLWVQKHLDDMLQTIPAKKIILGIPFYTRVWYESFSDTVPNKIKVRSRSVYMETPANMIKSKKNVSKVWDEDARQYFYAYFDVEKNEMVKFWYDDINALVEKSNLAVDKGLSGIAAWSLGFEDIKIWKELELIKQKL